ncbi:MAG: Membrane protein insertase YidC [Chlamydiae bacterium]|nr:Membrane protein insertase YidC [Chlamydiota bacterium]
MNKKSLFFLCVLSGAMLITNLFFKPTRKAEKAPQAIEQQVAKNRSFESEIATRAELPLVEIYKDAEGKNYLTSGVESNGQILTLAWQDSLPEKVYFKKSYSSFPLEQATPNLKDASLNDPILLSKNSEKGKLEASELPNTGSHTVQIIKLKPFQNSVDVTAARYVNGQLTLPSDIKLNNNALAVAKTASGEFEPVGVFVQSENRLVGVKNFLNLKSQVNIHKYYSPIRTTDEKFYILENENQQIVFSNYGGAVAEINLPFQDSDHSKSKVHAVELDEKLKERQSPHSLFPAHDYYTPDGTGTKSPKSGGYYPLIRRHVDAGHDSARYYAFNLVSDTPEVSELTFKMTHFDSNQIVFESNQNHRKITKTFTLDPSSPYGIDLKVKVEGDTSNLWLTTGVPEVELISNMQSPILKHREHGLKKAEISKDKLPKASNENTTATLDWVSNSNGFFTVLMDPQQTSLEPGYKVNKVKSSQMPTRIHSLPIGSKVKNTDGYEYLVPLKTTHDEAHFKIFAGPLDKNLLIQADKLNAKPSNYLGAQSYNGFLTVISEPVAKFLFILLNMFHKITSSWGLSIIFLTILLRLILYPLNAWSIKAMRKNQEIAPEVSAIQKKYKNNPKQSQMEIMALYRKRKVNPFTGCLPVLIQMPFLIGMFSLLRSAFVLRGVPFIQGWITNLTAPDVLFTWKQAIPFFGNEFHLLPLISLVMVWIQQKVSTPPVDKSNMTDQQKQQKLMGYSMMLIVTLFCYNFPSGLNLYFISSTLLGILQQWITNKLLDKQKNKPTIIKKNKALLKEEKA